MNDILDGTFRVFGKVTRVVSDNSESIDLMRRSSSGKFSGFIEELVSRMLWTEIRRVTPDHVH